MLIEYQIVQPQQISLAGLIDSNVVQTIHYIHVFLWIGVAHNIYIYIPELFFKVTFCAIATRFLVPHALCTLLRKRDIWVVAYYYYPFLIPTEYKSTHNGECFWYVLY